MPHDCMQDKRVRDLTARVDKLEVKGDTYQEDIKSIKSFQNKLLWGMLFGACSSTATLLLLIAKMKGVG